MLALATLKEFPRAYPLNTLGPCIYSAIETYMLCPKWRWHFWQHRARWMRRTSRCRHLAPSCSASLGGRRVIRREGGSGETADPAGPSWPEAHLWTTRSRHSPKLGSPGWPARYGWLSGWSGAEWSPEPTILQKNNGVYWLGEVRRVKLVLLSFKESVNSVRKSGLMNKQEVVGGGRSRGRGG